MPYRQGALLTQQQKNALTQNFALATDYPETVPDPNNPELRINNPMTKGKWLDLKVDQWVEHVVAKYLIQQQRQQFEDGIRATIGQLTEP